MFSRLLAALLLAALSTGVSARIGTIDVAPGATLLFPHFEVDTNNTQGVNTILHIQNASATASLLNVVLWTDLGVPVHNFNIYMTGYDNETVDLYNLLVHRYSPVTASDGQDPADTISPQGPISQDINFASCYNTLPSPNPDLTPITLRAVLSGNSTPDYFNGQCVARNYGDGIARGYVTVDVLTQCTTLKPNDTGYFNNGSAVAWNGNVLLGDYVIVDRPRGRFLAENAVHLEANSQDARLNGPGDYTFYGAVIGYTGADNREPLPTAFAGRYASARTEVDYWRDPGSVPAAFACSGTPAPFPLGQRHVSVFNDAGTLVGNPTGTLFPYVTGTTAGAGALGLSQPLGWLFVNLNAPAASGPTGAIRQGWLNLRQIPRSVPANSRMGYSVPAIQLGNAIDGADPILP